jgi:hypothetical protein
LASKAPAIMGNEMGTITYWKEFKRCSHRPSLIYFIPVQVGGLMIMVFKGSS